MSKIKYEKPKTLRQYIKLCERYGGVIVKRKHALKVVCSRQELDLFIRHELRGRTKVPLRDLIPWIRREHEDWDTVMETVDLVLIKIGVLSPNYNYDEHFEEA